MKNTMMKLLALLLALVMVTGVLAGCGGNNTPESNDPVSDNPEAEANPEGGNAEQAVGEPQRGGHVTYSWYELSPTFDPYGQASWTTYMWSNNNFESALVRGEDGEVYPLVCEYELSPDMLELKLWIREGVKFSDGTPVTLEDVVASLQRAAKFTPRVQTVLWDLATSYEIVDNVLIFKFSEYNVGTLDVFCNPRASYGHIMPKSICEKYGEKLIDDPNDCIGTGPYKLVPEASQAGVCYEFVRNEHYVTCEASPAGNGLASPRRQYLDGLTCIVNSDTSSQLMGLMNGNLDTLAQMDTMAYDTQMSPMGYTANTYATDGAYYAFFNCAENRVVADVNLRRAIAAVLSYDDLQFACRGELYEASIASPVNCEGYNNDAFTTKEWNAQRESNIEVAKKYLAQSSYSGEPIIMITDNSAAASIFIEDLAEIGIKCDRQRLDNQTMIAYANDGSLDWDIILRSNPYAVNYPTEMHNTYYNNWHNEKATELLAKLETQPVGSQESVATWNELADLMAEEVPFIIFGGVYEFYIYAPGLNSDRQGDWRYWFNDWWTDPASHGK